MATILIFTSELTPVPGLPTGGRGVRINNLADGLRQHGHSVQISFEQSSIDCLRQRRNFTLPGAWLALAHNHEGHNAVISAVKPDCIIFSPWTLALSFTPSGSARDLPIIFDLPASLALENVFEQRESGFLFIQKKLATLHLGDLFLVSNPRQKPYLYPYLMLAGVDLARDPVVVCPISAGPGAPPHGPYPDPPAYIFSGVLWKWQDYGDSLKIIADHCEQRGGTLRVCAGEFLYHSGRRQLDYLANRPGVELHGLVPHEQLCTIMLGASAAVELYLPNPERELASTTRTVEYLQHGLPVIYSDGMYYSDMIRQYDAGWVIDPADHAQLTAVLDEISADPGICARKGANARRLAAERFDPIDAAAALARFCTNPVKLLNKTDHISRLSYSLLHSIDNTRSQRERFREKLNSLQQQLTELSRQLAERQQQLADCRHDFERQQQQFATLAAEYAALQADTARIKSRFIFRFLLASKKAGDALLDLFRAQSH